MSSEPIISCFVSPHPDDIELYCGGMLLDHAARNDSLAVIMMTNGGFGSRNPLYRGEVLEKIRKQEALTRYALLDNVNLIFAEFKDGHVRQNTESVTKITLILQQIKPDIIYLPEFIPALSERGHCDHLHTGKIIMEASQHLDYPLKLRCYHSKAINYIHAIDPFFKENNQALQCYKSQRGISFGPFKTGIQSYLHHYNKKRRLWGKHIGARYGEGFREIELNCVNGQRGGT
jgi:LmbE family N-acetylglucosaminyl deacetylase